MIQIDKISFSYKKVSVFNNISCTIPKGSLVAIFGPNGIGKTTLMKIIAGIIKPTSGNIILDSSNIGFLVQRSTLNLDFPISVFDLVCMGLYKKNGMLQKISSDQMTNINDAIDLMNLSEFKNHPIGELSGGQFQKALFARLMVQNPDIILLDEPFNAIDCQSLKLLIDQINQWHKEGKTILSVLHDWQIILRYYTECILLGPGFFNFLSTTEIEKDQRLLSQVFFCGKHLGEHGFNEII